MRSVLSKRLIESVAVIGLFGALGASGAAAQVIALPTAQAALLGRFARGPINLPLAVNPSQFQTWFGSANPAAWPAEVQAREFFANGGTSLYIVRVLESGALADALIGKAADASGLTALEPLSDLRVLIAPELSLLTSSSFTTAFAAFRAFVEARRIFFILDPPPGLTTSAAMVNWVSSAVPDAAPFCAVYYPYLQVQLDGVSLTTTASGAMAAIYQKNDDSVGPWNSPAGTGFPLQATGLTPGLTTSDYDALNTQNINAIRQFPGSGIVPFGARTLDRLNEANRYVAVTRMEDWVAASIERSLSFAAIADDAAPLWTQITNMVANFLNTLWMQGAFQGTTPNQAYFVRCDSTTTTAADVAAHRVNLLYGMALLQASEFEITQLSASTYDSGRATPIPILRPLSFDGTLFLPYPTVAGFNYTLQSRSGLATGSWTNAATVNGDGAWRTPMVPMTANAGFFRLQVMSAR